ncbi:hypothetical protein DOTSEDRAFT_134830 [Dothistroma septosporum NZE10]|uniref:Galactose oxidase-like Early set domain-containing protein n=1 Tax=Dothistroma septosporum (strain NZE10 / CBS 128990) TaxID=675120 RepID=N1PFX2_DOTSN|nr:hypothetical protein DOTSEDRAFT_134830 [Dothistroma septosporum NZE10]
MSWPDSTIIATCPGGATNYTSPAGKVYELCPNTEFSGVNAQTIQNVTSLRACAVRCGAINGCAKALYDRNNQICMIKPSDTDVNQPWVANTQYDSVRAFPTYNPAVQGQWSDFIRLPVVPVAAYVVPAFPTPARLLFFAAWSPDTFDEGPEGYTQFADYNFDTGAVSERNVTKTDHDMFCPGISTLGGGRIIITGGANAAKTSIYDPASNSFIAGPPMNKARGYQASAAMSDGRVFTVGGSWSGGVGNKTGEVFDPKANTWTLVPGADPAPLLTQDNEDADIPSVSKRDDHAWLFGWKQGSIFQAGPSRRQNWYMTSDGGSVGQAGTRSGNDSMCAAFAMYDVGKILSAGGARDYSGDLATASGHITTINEPGQPSVIESVPDMSRPRAFPNAVVLPDGQVLVTGGQKTGLPFTDTDGVWEAELFNPGTRTWTRMAPESVTRAYHAASILLPDARVWSGGGGLCFASPGQSTESTAGCDKTINHPNGQIFSPPYLFTRNGVLATRPVISSISNNQPRIGSTITVTMGSSDAMTFAFLRMGSATHSVNTDQRRIPVQATQSGSTYTIVLPSDSGIMLPGNWYLFAVNQDGVPSVARTVQVKL